MKATFRRVGNALHPVGRHAHEVLGKLPDDKDVMVEVWRPRNPQHHRKFWALLKLVVDNTEQFRTPEALLDALKLELQYIEPVMRLSGSFEYRPKSIAFESMAQDAFAEFYDRALDVICEHWPGMSRHLLDDEVKREAA